MNAVLIPVGVKWLLHVCPYLSKDNSELLRVQSQCYGQPYKVTEGNHEGSECSYTCQVCRKQLPIEAQREMADY